MALKSVSVKISERRYSVIRKDAKANGHTLTWLLNYIIDLYYQEKEKNADVPKFPAQVAQ